MSILESMRSGTDSTAMQVVLALVLVSFVFWYAQPNGDTTKVVATVNGTRIMDTDLTRAYRQAAQRYDRSLSDDEAAALQERVRQQLIDDEVLRQEAHHLGLTVSDTEIARELLKIKIFKNEQGLFDQRIYAQWLRRNAYASRSDFEEQLRNDILRSKLRQLVYLGVTVSEPALKQAFIEQNTRVDIQYARIRPQAFRDDVKVSDAGIDAFIKDSMARVKAVYDADFSRLYDIPGKVKLTMIRFQLRDDGPGAADLRPRLEKLAKQIQGGADMADLARRYSEDASAAKGGDLGEMAVPQLSTPVASAIENLKPGELGDIVVEDNHVDVYRLDEREAAHIIPIEDVQKKIAEGLIRQDRAPALAADFAEKVLAQWKADGKAPDELLKGQQISAASTGPIPISGGQPSAFSPPDEMLQAAAQKKKGTVLPEVYSSGDTLWVGEVADRKEADLDMLRDDHDMVREMVLAKKRQQFYQGWMDSLVAQADVQ